MKESRPNRLNGRHSIKSFSNAMPLGLYGMIGSSREFFSSQEFLKYGVFVCWSIHKKNKKTNVLKPHNEQIESVAKNYPRNLSDIFLNVKEGSDVN